MPWAASEFGQKFLDVAPLSPPGLLQTLTDAFASVGVAAFSFARGFWGCFIGKILSLRRADAQLVEAQAEQALVESEFPGFGWGGGVVHLEHQP
jgi:hypothetical protein